MNPPLLHILGAAALTAAALTGGGCAGPLSGERDAFDRWHRLDASVDTARHGDAAGADIARAGRSPLPTEALPESPVLRDYLAHAMAHHPGLEGEFHEWRAALERVPQARAWMDPQVNYRYVLRAMDERQAIGLSQTFPWYGRLQASGNVAMEAALAAEQRFEQQRQQVAFDVLEAYAEYAYLARALDVARESRRILEDLEASAQARFETGAAPYADLVRAELAVEQASDEIRTLEAQRDPVVARLNAAIGRPAHLALPWPARLDRPPLASDEQALLEQLARGNPELRALEHETTGRRHGLRLARQNRIPEVMLGVEYMDMIEARDAVGLMASINIPLWSETRDAERAEAMAAFGAATRRRVDRENELAADLRLAYFRFRDAARRVDFFEQTLLPTAREALEASEAAYAAGETEFEAVAQAQSALQELQLTVERLLVDRFQAVAQIERLVGRVPGDPPDRPEADTEPAP